MVLTSNASCCSEYVLALHACNTPHSNWLRIFEFNCHLGQGRKEKKRRETVYLVFCPQQDKMWHLQSKSQKCL